jgi:hypothetical protein
MPNFYALLFIITITITVTSNKNNVHNKIGNQGLRLRLSEGKTMVY